MKQLKLGLAVILLLFVSTELFAQTATPPADGDGSSGDPYQIEILDNLYWITQNSGEWDKYYIQMNDIDASSTSSWDGGSGFYPIGDKSVQFTGNYNGNGHVIDDLFISRSGLHLGLFGVTEGSTISNLGATNVDITSTSSAGGLVGSHSGSSTINNCYTTGIATSSGSYVGGLVGSNIFSSTITNSYSAVEVSGDENIGGFAGNNSDSGDINRCYSVGEASGNLNVGGFIGTNSATVSNSFWNTTTSGLTTSAGGYEKTTEQMKDVDTFTDTVSAWDFIYNPNNDSANDDIWKMNGS